MQVMRYDAVMSHHIARWGKMVGLAPLACLSLAACSTTPTARPVAEKIVTVEKPIPVACVDAAKVPAEPRHVAGDLSGQAKHDLDVVSASAIELRGWGERLFALIQPCTKP